MSNRIEKDMPAEYEKLQMEVAACKRIESELRESEAKFRDLTERSLAGVYLIQNGNLIYVNSTFAGIFGYSADELANRSYEDVVFPADLPYVKECVRKKVDGEEPTSHYSFRGLKKNGTIIDVEVYSSKTVYKGDIAIIGTLLDITERKRAETALQLSEDRYKALYRDNPTMIFTIDAEGTILSVNPLGAGQLGYTIEEFEGRSVLDIFHEDDRPVVTEQLRRCLLSPDRVFRWQLRKIRKDGGLIWVEELARAVYDINGVINVLIVCQDITERIMAAEERRLAHEELERRVVERTRELSEANKKLLELDRLKSMFIASMSHELRTPLNSVIGFASILLNEWAGPLNQEQKDNLSVILRSGKHLLVLINDVIDVSKIEAGRIEVAVSDFDLYDLVIEAAAAFAKEISGKPLELKIEVHRQLMHTDRSRLLQCLLNLMSNAIKFTRKGTITIGTAQHACPEALHEEAECIEISVADTGVGIGEEDIPKLFNPFVRLESPLTAKVSGTGLGLYLTRKLVAEVLKGEITCTSKYGEGSVFTINIPVTI